MRFIIRNISQLIQTIYDAPLIDLLNQLMMETPQHKSLKTSWIRFLVMGLASLMLFGSIYCFDNPQALEDSIEEELGISETQFNLLYAYFSFPPIITAVLIGFAIDKIGVRVSVIILALGVTIAQFIISIGVAADSFSTMLAGRALFGIFCESLITAQITMVSFWFKGKELATSLGLVITLPELGGAVNSFLTPVIYESSGSLSAGFFVGAVFCFISFCCSIALFFVEKYVEKVDGHPIAEEAGHADESIKLSDLKQFNAKVWIILIGGSIAAALYVPFMDNANRYYQKRYCFTQTDAGLAVMTIYLSAIAFSLPLGLIVDKYGKRLYFFIGTLAVFLIAQIIYLAIPNCDGELMDRKNIAYLGSVIEGLGYAMYANCVVPLFPYVVRNVIMGTALGLLSSIENIAEAVIPEISAAILKGQGPDGAQAGYRYSSVFYVCLGIVGVAVACVMIKFKRTWRKLNEVVVQTKSDTVSEDQHYVSQAQNLHKNSRPFKQDQLQNPLLQTKFELQL